MASIKKSKTATSRFSCENCVAVFNSMTSLNEHKNFICGREESFQCGKCDMKFFMKKYVGTHLKKKHHIYDKNFDEHVINLANTSNEDLMRIKNEKRKSQNEFAESATKFPCNVCVKTFASSYELMMHK